jgi:hypothetical protein
MKRIDLAGQRFGRLIVVEFSGLDSWHEANWRCRCDCGKEKVIPGSKLRLGNTKSCGCMKAERIGNSRRTHGRTGTSEYRTWRAMRERCASPNNKDFKDYGGRGIKVCVRWEKFENFLADMGPRPKGRSLHRVDNNGLYEPENCKWETWTEQARNRRPRKFYSTYLRILMWAA